MTRSRVPFSHWSWDQIILILGPIAVTVVLVALYAAGWLPVDLVTLLVIVAAVNVAGDLAFALKNERSVKRGRTVLSNETVGRRGVAADDFSGERLFRGVVLLGPERWQAVSDDPVTAGDEVEVTGRSGLVLKVSHTD